MDVGQDRRTLHASRQPARLSGARWPARAQQMLEASLAVCLDGLQEPLRRCVAEFEQQLFKRAELASKSLEQQDFFASRQRVLQERGSFAGRFNSRLLSRFNEIDSATVKPVAPGDSPAWLSLELVDPNEQELTIAIDQIGARGDARHSAVLYELGYRLAVLVGTPPMDGEALPLGPHALSLAFHQASSDLQLPLSHHLLLLQHFDQSVIQQLAPLYEAINAQLQADGILPQLRSIPRPRQPSPRSRPAPPEAETVTTESAPANAAPQPAIAHGDSIAVLESLRDLLAQRRGGPVGAGGQAPGRVASADELQLAMGALQQHLVQVADHASRELRSAQRLREELLAQLNIDKPAGAARTELSGEQDDTVELVAMLFEQLGKQLQSGGSGRALLGGLQLPVLRMAVNDHAFFEKQDHPARKLLDTVAVAANDWLDGSDDENNRPLAAKLEQLVERASNEPPSAGLYTTLLADIEHHLALLSRKAQAAERRHVEAAQGRERLDQARKRAGELMAERFAVSPPRGLLRTLLDRAWSDVLALTLLRHGEDSDAFKAQLEITDQLLGRLPIRDRQELQNEVESGLQQIGMHAEESVQVAQRLLGSEKIIPPAGLPSTTDLALRLKQHHRLGEQSEPEPAAVAVTVATSVSAPVMDSRRQAIEQRLKKLPFGSWFEFIDPTSGQITQRKLAWYSPMSGRCLLVSRRGQRGEEISLSQLAQEMADGRVREAPVEQRDGLLDRAWRGLTGALRQSVSTSEHDRPEPGQ
jgi:hypothetical protein